jgi:putative acyl-CoA dehydrogenase
VSELFPAQPPQSLVVTLFHLFADYLLISSIDNNFPFSLILNRYMFAGSAALSNCPLAMTDGAARVLELTNDTFLQQTALRNLTSRDPKTFWTSGQWMTERAGGSDVSVATETVAKPIAPGSHPWVSVRLRMDDLDSNEILEFNDLRSQCVLSYIQATHQLFGVKWFSSATDCDMALALARDADVVSANKSRPGADISLYFVQLRDANGQLNNIEVLRLKDKVSYFFLPIFFVCCCFINGDFGKIK